MRHLVLAMLVALLLAPPVQGASAPSSFAYVTTNDGKIVRVDTVTNQVVGSPITLPGDRPSSAHGVAVSADGSRIYVVHDVFVGSRIFGRLSMLDKQSGAVTFVTGANGNPIDLGRGVMPRGVAVQGSKVYVTRLISATMLVLDTALNTSTDVPVGFFAFGVAVHGRRAYVTHASGSRAITVVDTETNTVLTGDSGLPRYYGQFAGVAVSPDGRWVYAANNAGQLWVVDADSLEPRDVGESASWKALTVGLDPYGIVLSPDGRRLYVANGGSGTVSVVNTEDPASAAVMPGQISVGSNPRGISVASDGSRVYVASQGRGTIEPPSVSAIRTVDNSVTPIPLAQTLVTGPVSFGTWVDPVMPPIPVAFQVMQNAVNPNKQGKIPVVVFGSKDFHVNEVDWTSVTISGASIARSGLNGELMVQYGFHKRDGEDDGILDAMIHIEAAELVVDTVQAAANGDPLLKLKGNLQKEFGDLRFEGEAPVRFIR